MLIREFSGHWSIFCIWPRLEPFELWEWCGLHIIPCLSPGVPLGSTACVVCVGIPRSQDAQRNAHFSKGKFTKWSPNIVRKTVFFLNSILVHFPVLLVIRCWNGGSLIYLMSSQVNKTTWFATKMFFRHVLILLASAHFPNSHLFCVRSSRREIWWNLGINGGTRHICI